MLRRTTAAVIAVAALVLVTASSAWASQIVGRNAKGVGLEINAKGIALVTFRDGSGLKHILAWGAVNDDVEFKVDYPAARASTTHLSGRRSRSRAVRTTGRRSRGRSPRARRRTVRTGPCRPGSACSRTTGACVLEPLRPAGSCTSRTGRARCRQLAIMLDRQSSGGSTTSLAATREGKPVYGFGNTSTAATRLDDFGRNIYVDTFNSATARAGSARYSFLTHRPRRQRSATASTRGAARTTARCGRQGTESAIARP